MIYRVVLDDTIDIHTSDINCMLLNPSIELEMNSAGSFTFTLPPTHPNWDDFRVLKSTIDVYENNELIFTGRVASIEKNWNNERVVKCEGALAYFNDSIHRQMKWENPLPIASEDPTVHNFLKDILDNHNVFEGSENLNRHIYIGHIYIDTELVTREVDYDTTLDILTRMCIDTNGGYFQIRKDPEDGKLYLDWLKDFTDESSQPASFGLNLLDFNTSLSAEDICTGVLARGATVNDQVVTLTDVELVDETTYPDYSVTHYTDHDQDILWHRDGVATFGQVVQVKDFSDAQVAWKDQSSQVVANSLFEVAKKWLEEKNTKVETIEVEVAELAWLGDGYPQYKLGQIVEVIDSVHMSGESGTTRLLPMYKLSCDLMSGSKKVTLGTPPKKELTQISASNSDSSTLSSTSSSGSSGGGSGSGEDCKVHDVRVDGTSVVSNKIANISLAGKADVSTVNALAATVANKADTSTVNALANVVSGKQDQIEFNTLEAATETLTRLKADNVVYNLGGGTEVVANPSETATDDLTTIKIGNTVYDIPGGGGGSGQDYECDLLFDNDPLPSPTSGTSNVTRTYQLSDSIDDYDAVLVLSGDGYTSTNLVNQLVLKTDFYRTDQNGSLFLNNASINGYTRRLYFEFTDSTHIQTVATRSNANEELMLYRVYGLKFKSSIDIFSPQIYSEEERIVGTWIDGKPLYQKTIDCGALPNTTSKEISSGLTNENVVNLFGYSLRPSDGIMLHLPYCVTQIPYSNTGQVAVNYSNDAHKIFIYTSIDRSTFTETKITLQYTKTTDTAGSSHWLSGGVMAVNYTEEEQIIGQWMGKTLYQKTFTKTFTGATSNWVLFDDSVSYDKLINVFTDQLNTNGEVLPILQDKEASPRFRSYNNVIDYYTTITGSVTYAITLQYTKTTDTAGNPMANILATQKELEEIAYHYRDHCYTTLSDYYSTEERVVGRWTDGKPVYQCTFDLGSDISISTNWAATSVPNTNMEQVVKCISFIHSNGVAREEPEVQVNYGSYIRLCYTSGSNTGRYLTIQYTKTTDTPGTGPTPGNLVYLPALYSEEEREVGVWIDGKPLYQKTFLFEGPYTNQITNLPISLDNPEHAFILEAHCLNQNNAIITLPYVNHQTEANVGVFLSATMDSIGLRIVNITTCKSIRATIQYTKTTDQPGSGKYLPDGQYAHHYSTSEKIVGTWIDGSTIYERTWDFVNDITVSRDTWTNTSILKGNINRIIDYTAMGGTGANRALDLSCDNTYIQLLSMRNGGDTVRYLTLQYTKST